MTNYLAFLGEASPVFSASVKMLTGIFSSSPDVCACVYFIVVDVLLGELVFSCVELLVDVQKANASVNAISFCHFVLFVLSSKFPTATITCARKLAPLFPSDSLIERLVTGSVTVNIHSIVDEVR